LKAWPPPLPVWYGPGGVFDHSASIRSVTEDLLDAVRRRAGPRRVAALRTALCRSPNLPIFKPGYCRSWAWTAQAEVRAHMPAAPSGTKHRPQPLPKDPTNSEDTAMDKDRIEGAAQQAKGAVKEAAGKLLGDKKLETEGKTDKAVGKVQNAIGGLKDTVRGN
jgi:uncharacterized protein YjbJ (UPF0337 family)